MSVLLDLTALTLLSIQSLFSSREKLRKFCLRHLKIEKATLSGSDEMSPVGKPK